MIPGLNFGGGGSFDFGDLQGGDIRTGPLSIDARTTTGGGDPEILGSGPILHIGIGIALGVVAYMLFKGRK